MVVQIRTLFAAASLSLLLSACFPPGPTPPPASTINASDDSVFQPVFRMAKSLSETPDAPSDPHGGHAIEFGYTQGSGSSSQTFGSNYVGFGNQQFTAPTTLSYDFNVTYVDIAYRFRLLREFATFGVEALVGLAQADLDFTVSSPGRSAKEGLSSGGAQLGLGAILRPRPGTSVHARAIWFSSGDDNGVSKLSRFDLYLAQAIWRYASLRLGYSIWSMESDRGGTVSPINVDFRGLVLGLEAMF